MKMNPVAMHTPSDTACGGNTNNKSSVTRRSRRGVNFSDLLSSKQKSSTSFVRSRPGMIPLLVRTQSSTSMTLSSTTCSSIDNLTNADIDDDEPYEQNAPLSASAIPEDDLGQHRVVPTCTTLKQGILKKQSAEVYNSTAKHGKNVRFESRILTFTATDYDDIPYHCIWWSKLEIKDNKVEQQKFTVYDEHVKAIAREYLFAYNKGRKQVHEHSISNKKGVLSKEYYHSLVLGRTYGFAGLEQYSRVFLDTLNENRSIVKEIVHRHRELNEKKVNNRNILLGMSPNNNTGWNGLYDDIAEQLGMYARALTSADRSWAFLLGNADKEAAAAQQ